MPLFPRLVPQSHSSAISYNDLRPLIEAVLEDPSYYNQSPSHASCHKPRQTHHDSHSKRAFSPSFDVRETEQAYILEGELPGLNDKNNVEIEFTDHQTLLVKGRIERTLHNSNAASASEKQHTTTTRSEDKEHEAHRPQTPPHPTVEDDVDEDDKASTVIKPTEKKSPPQPQQPEKPKVRYWITERQVGEFQRSFSFPGLIDQEGVTAKLANGVLTIEVPKRTAHVVKRIQIQ